MERATACSCSWYLHGTGVQCTVSVNARLHTHALCADTMYDTAVRSAYMHTAVQLSNVPVDAVRIEPYSYSLGHPTSS